MGVGKRVWGFATVSKIGARLGKHSGCSINCRGGASNDERCMHRLRVPAHASKPAAARYSLYGSTPAVDRPMGARRMWSGMANASTSGTATPRSSPHSEPISR